MNSNEQYSGASTSSSSQNPEVVHQFVDEQGRTVYLENPYFYEENGTTVVYGEPYEAVPSEIYHEEAIVEETFPEQGPSTSRPTNKSILIKDNFAPSTVLLTSRCLEAENAQFIATAGKKAKKTAKNGGNSKISVVNQEGSSLNRNLPGMKNMFKVMTESAMKKAEDFLESVKNVEEVVEEEEEDSVDDKKCSQKIMEDLEDEEEQGDTPPPMEKIVDDGSEFLDSCFDQWPLYSNNAIDFKEACELLIGIQSIEKEKICKTLPMQFKHEGTFFIETTNIHNMLDDNNGEWEKPSGKTRYYHENEWGHLVRADDGKGRLKQGIHTFSYKILLKRYENKVTKSADDGRGQFQKKIYTGIKGNKKMEYAIITYSWCSGRPWNFVPPIPIKDPRMIKKSNWEKKSYEKVNMTEMPQVVSAFYDGFNIYSHCVISFDDAAAIMLGATAVEPNKICSSVPLGYRQNGTFVIDLKRMGHCLLELRRDDNGLWSKPSGFARFYKFAENGDAVRVDKSGKLPAGVQFDVKICSKRYEHTQVDKKFVRKIYTAKGENSDSFHGSPEFAVIVYYWKGEPIQFEPIYKQNMVRTDNKVFNRYQQMADEETEYVETSGTIEHVQTQEDQLVIQEDILNQPPIKRGRFEPSLTSQSSETMLELKMTLIRREMENQERFSSVLDRAETLLGRIEHRFGVVEEEETVVYAGEPVHNWNEEIIEEEEVIHTDYHTI